MPAIRIALFICDAPIPAVQATDGTYTDIFDALWRNSLPEQGSPGVTYEMNSFDVRHKMAYPEDIDRYHAIAYTGSAASAYENLDWINKLVEYTGFVGREKPHIKLFGICFGHQIISRALGEECVPNNGLWEVGLTTVQLTDVGKALFGVDSVNIQEMHRDHVPRVPANCQLLGTTPVAYNQGYIRYAPSAPPSPSVTDIQIFTVQGHPEFTERIVNTVVEMRESTGVIDKATADDARSRAKWRNDGAGVIARAMWRILGVNGV